MTALKWITTEAKRLKKAYPKRFAKWTEYVAQASAIYAKKHGGQSPVGKKKKTVGDYKINKGEFVESRKPTKPRKKKLAKKKVFSVTRLSNGRFKKKGIKRISGTGTHKDTKSHNVNIRVVSGVNKTIMSGIKIGALPKYNDPDAAREIQLYADNDSGLYFSQKKPIILNLQKKYKAGKYDVEKAAILWKYFVEAADKKYQKEFGSRKKGFLLSVNDRKLLARDYAINTLNEFELGNFF